MAGLAMQTVAFLLVLISFAKGDDLQEIHNERIKSITASYYNPNLAIALQQDLTSDGNWTDVDYTTGCPARRANWPAQDHFHKILTMSSSWIRNQTDEGMLGAISTALDHWFDRDFKHDDCINAGGNANYNCPCETPGFWNTNWYDQMILIPNLVGMTCLLLLPVLTPTQFSNCTVQTSRAYVRIDGDPNGSMGPMTGANVLDVASIGVSLSIISSNHSLLEEAVGKIFNECRITEGIRDGIKVDGSYMQHDGQIYTGNYGKVFMNNMLRFFKETANTSLGAGEGVQGAFLTLMEGAEWFVYLKGNNQSEGVGAESSWHYSVIGRMVSHKYADWHGIDLKLADLIEATDKWEQREKFQDIVDRLNATEVIDVNPGDLVGTKYFFVADYMVHRGADYITTLKMFSSRTTNSECNNGQNPFGFHLSDGSIYTYTTGDEYTDVYGAWDWNLIPGTTVAYGSTPLACSSVQHKGKESFVGGLSLDHFGVAVMNYTNPYALASTTHFLKSFFFFPKSYIVQFVGDVVSGSTSAPVFTTLDQCQLQPSGVFIDDVRMTSDFTQTVATKVWHNRQGWEFLQPVILTVDLRPREADWEKIGISKGNETQTHFTAYFEHPRELPPQNFKVSGGFKPRM